MYFHCLRKTLCGALLPLLLIFCVCAQAETVLDQFHKSYPARIKKESSDSGEETKVQPPAQEGSDSFEENDMSRLPDNLGEPSVTPEEEEEAPVEPMLQPQPSPHEVVVASQQLVPATTIEFQTPWGMIPFCHKAAYHYDTERGPGFTIPIPEDWKRTEPQKHPVLGGMQYRYIAPSGYPHAPYVVVAVFPMKDDVDLADFLSKKQVAMFSSFKFKEAHNVSLGRRSGIGVYYEGILKMSDVSCHLFLTRYKGKGYAVYGLYFDRAGGEAIGKVMNSIRISQ
ncbi:MAG: hypothetical protein JXA52_09940 [Planctomycetes bacterium]|nr:hypothetical protein [Planctomycetota bacterium]